MAAVAIQQEPAVQFAQRLASNERPVRSKALKKLRKYLAVRSQKAKGAFTEEELLKVWKGLFYCVWMQDKPLLQEELCGQISSLIHSLQNVDIQFLFFNTFLQTINREWNGIDRFRMDKFYMLVRFVFRQTLEMLKKRDWNASLVERFKEIMNSCVLRSTSDAPSGLQFHILDFFLEELGRVGAAELTAEQNLAFIDPFCKVAAKTKNHMFLQAICSGIFQEIVDQAPFAIEDLMRELCRERRAKEEDSTEEEDSGQASAEEEEEHEKKPESRTAPHSSKKAEGKQINGLPTGEDEDDGDTDEDEPSDFGEDGSDILEDGENTGPVLQFHYKAVADRLLEHASRGNVSGFNRKKLYKVVKTFQDLSEGVFPHDGYPGEVSTDEDDDEMFGSRKRLKKKRRNNPEEDREQGTSAAKKRKGKKEGKVEVKQKEGAAADEAGVNDPTVRKKKKKGKSGEAEGSKQGEVSAEGAQEVPGQPKSPAAEETPIGLGKRKGKGQKRKTSASLVTPKPLSAEETIEVESVPAGEAELMLEVSSVADMPTQKKKRRRRKQQKGDCPPGPEPCTVTAGLRGEEYDSAPEQQDGELELKHTAETPVCKVAGNKNKKKKKQRVQQEAQQGMVEAQKAAEVYSTVSAVVDVQTSSESPVTQVTKKKKKNMKRKLETELPERVARESVSINGDSEGSRAKKLIKTTYLQKSDSISSPACAKKPKKTKPASEGQADFVSFQSPSVPVPLFCRTGKRSPAKLLCLTPRSLESKKVTFGLKNNKTAEFRKTDRSLLVSPDGSSRVPFDPQQKPRFSVLKSPVGTQTKKKGNSATKGRPCAADFF